MEAEREREQRERALRWLRWSGYAVGIIAVFVGIVGHFLPQERDLLGFIAFLAPVFFICGFIFLFQHWFFLETVAGRRLLDWSEKMLIRIFHAPHKEKEGK